MIEAGLPGSEETDGRELDQGFDLALSSQGASDSSAATALSRATEVSFEGEGPFLLPFLTDEVSFGLSSTVVIMRMRTATGQDVLLPFERETLRTLGLALADALKDAFQNERERLDPSDVVFVEPGGRE